MDIKAKGGEFSLIEEISKIPPGSHIDLIKGVGDDAAVIRSNNDGDNFTLVTTDMLVENTHFKKNWSSPEHIGIKAVECNVSDIAAMGGNPSFIFISLILTDNIQTSWVKKLYHGISLSCVKHGVVLAGGDTTKGELCAINITLLGSVSPKKLCLRKHGKPGDILAVTGYLGGAAAGLEMLSAGDLFSKYLFNKYVTPQCRISEALCINKIVNAMIDISDGLSGEINHICNNSNTGAEIYENNIPIHEEVKIAAKLYNKNALILAMTGGEDLELLFSFKANQANLIRSLGVPYYVIGKLTKNIKERILIRKSGEKETLPNSYDHFN